MNPLERTIADLLRPPVRAYRGEAVERLAVAKDRATVTDELTGTLRTPESRVGIAVTGYSQVGWTDYTTSTIAVYAGSNLLFAGDEGWRAGAIVDANRLVLANAGTITVTGFTAVVTA